MQTHDEHQRPEGTVALRLTIRPGDPPEGVLSRDDGRGDMPFHGWIDLMAAITEACRSEQAS